MVNKVISLEEINAMGIKEESEHIKNIFNMNERKNMDKKCHGGLLKTRVLGQLLNDLSSKFLDSEVTERNYTTNGYLCCFNNLSGEISDKVLEFGYDLFLKMATCIRIPKEINDAYEMLILNSSQIMITQEFFRLNSTRKRKVKSRREINQKRIIDETTVPLFDLIAFSINNLDMEYQTMDEEKLKKHEFNIPFPAWETFVEKIQMKYQTIEAILSSEDSCIRLRNCTALKNKMKTIGKQKLIYP